MIGATEVKATVKPAVVANGAPTMVVAAPVLLLLDLAVQQLPAIGIAQEVHVAAHMSQLA